MPMLTTSRCRAASFAKPVSTSAYRPVRFQRRWPSRVCRALANRWTTSMVIEPSRTTPTTTRPLEAPMSMAATVVGGAGSLIRTSSAQEGGGDAGVDGDVQTGGVGQVGGAEHEHGVGHVLGQHLPLQQRALGVVLAELLLL